MISNEDLILYFLKENNFISRGSFSLYDRFASRKNGDELMLHIMKQVSLERLFCLSYNEENAIRGLLLYSKFANMTHEDVYYEIGKRIYSERGADISVSKGFEYVKSQFFYMIKENKGLLEALNNIEALKEVHKDGSNIFKLCSPEFTTLFCMENMIKATIDPEEFIKNIYPKSFLGIHGKLRAGYYSGLILSGKATKKNIRQIRSDKSSVASKTGLVAFHNFKYLYPEYDTWVTSFNDTKHLSVMRFLEKVYDEVQILGLIGNELFDKRILRSIMNK
jgi:hypothetical protein